MIALLCFFLTLFASLFKSKSRLEAENAALRHQLIVLQRKTRGRVHLTNRDRLFLVHLYRWFPSVLKAITIIRPETLVRWHRAGFRRYWRWKSRSLGGRPRIAADLRALIRQMSAASVEDRGASADHQRFGCGAALLLHCDARSGKRGAAPYVGARAAQDAAGLESRRDCTPAGGGTRTEVQGRTERGLRRRTAGLRGGGTQGVRRRLQANAAADRTGQGAEGSLCDALASAARSLTRLVSHCP